VFPRDERIDTMGCSVDTQQGELPEEVSWNWNCCVIVWFVWDICRCCVKKPCFVWSHCSQARQRASQEHSRFTSLSGEEQQRELQYMVSVKKVREDVWVCTVELHIYCEKII
jgi:hypothetical protein